MGESAPPKVLIAMPAYYNEEKYIGSLVLQAKQYTDEVIVVDDGDYNVQRKLLQDALNSLVLPETDAALNAGESLESLGLVWGKATLEEKQ